MKSVALVLVAVVLSVCGSLVVVHAQTRVPLALRQPLASRFQLLSEDGLVRPDLPDYVVGTKVWTVADKGTGACYVLFLVGPSTAVSPIACP
jgi:hypothetical protein